jgi:iron complex transport system ATP-binding protein
MIKATEITKNIGRKNILTDCGLDLQPGRLMAVVGPNGAGKTSLLKIISGEDRKFNGHVQINGYPLHKLTTRDLSRLRAILPQYSMINFPFTAEQVVEIGRFSHRSGAQEDRMVIHESMRITRTEQFRKRLYHTLSGGEKQRVQMARVISQITSKTADPRYMLLDEPTSSLDLAQQHVLLSLAKSMCNKNIGVLAVLHDLNLALQYADDIVMMKDGRVVASGPMQSTLSEHLIEDTFGHPVRLFHHNGQPVIIPVSKKSNGQLNDLEQLNHSIHEPSKIRVSYHGQ